MTDARTLSHRDRTANGYRWAYSESGAHFYTRPGAEKGWNLIRVLPTDLENGNFELFAQYGLTNTNPVQQ